MSILTNKKYILSFVVNSKTLTYTGIIKSIDSVFICFIDKFGNEVTYNISQLSSATEVKEND